jgi:hypothetical protein
MYFDASDQTETASIEKRLVRDDTSTVLCITYRCLSLHLPEYIHPFPTVVPRYAPSMHICVFEGRVCHGICEAFVNSMDGWSKGRIRRHPARAGCMVSGGVAGCRKDRQRLDTSYMQ